MRGLEQIPWLYDLGLWFAEKLGFIRWRRWLAEGATGRTLDVGTGTGRNLTWFSAARMVIAIDPSRHNLRAALARLPGTLLVRARAEALPFRDAAFDTVVSGLVWSLLMYGGPTVAGVSHWLMAMQGTGLLAALVTLVVLVPGAGKLVRVDPVAQPDLFDALRKKQARFGMISGLLGLLALFAGAMGR